MAEILNNRVLEWAPITDETTVVAGQIGKPRPTDELLWNPEDIHDNRIDGSLYVADTRHHRIQKWLKGASAGYTVAGSSVGRIDNDSASLTYPLAVWGG